MDDRVPTCLEEIKQHYMDASISISHHWDLEFHVDMDAFNIIIRAMLV
jgi:hypothetical protein